MFSDEYSRNELASYTAGSFHCYAQRHGYEFLLSDASPTCKTQHPASFFFQRHCTLMEFMKSLPDDWFLLVDRDIAVMNFDRKLEEFIPSGGNVSLIFQERIQNNEIAAGAYLVRYSKFVENFFDRWLSMASLLEITNENTSFFHNYDNGVLHLVILWFSGNFQASDERRLKRYNQCERFLLESLHGTYVLYDSFIGCCRSQIYQYKQNSDNQVDHIPELRIIRKGHGFIRDFKVSFGWSTSDFLYHGVEGTIPVNYMRNVSGDCDTSTLIDPKSKIGIGEVRANVIHAEEVGRVLRKPAFVGYPSLAESLDCYPFCTDKFSAPSLKGKPRLVLPNRNKLKCLWKNALQSELSVWNTFALIKTAEYFWYFYKHDSNIARTCDLRKWDNATLEKIGQS